MPKPVWVKGGNSAQNNNNVCVSAYLIKQFMYNLISTINKSEMDSFLAHLSTVYEPSGDSNQFINLGQDLGW